MIVFVVVLCVAPFCACFSLAGLRACSQLLRFGINHVICYDELKMSMLACATLFPAFLPFAINAMRSSSDYTVPMNNT